MSFGYSIGDFITAGELALKVYREYRDAPAQFAAISAEVGSLRLMLNDVDSTIKNRKLSAEEKSDLIQISIGCKSVLTDLDALLQKYRDVGKKTRWSWDRLRWHQGDIREMRSRVISHTGFLNSFNLSLTSSVTSRIEEQLIQLRTEIQSGRRESSVITVTAMEAAQEGDENIWQEISRELEDAGITQEMINEHRVFITNWVINAFNSSQLEENPPRDAPESDSRSQDSNGHKSDLEPVPDDAAKGEPYITYDIEGECNPREDFDSDDGSDEFLSGAAKKIAEFQRLGREAMESLHYTEARQHLIKARDLANLLFGKESSKVKESNSILAEAYMRDRSETSEGQLDEDGFQLPNLTPIGESSLSTSLPTGSSTVSLPFRGIPGPSGSLPAMTKKPALRIHDEQEHPEIKTLAEKLQRVGIEWPRGSLSYFIPADELDKLVDREGVQQALHAMFPNMEEQHRNFYRDSICHSARKIFAILLRSDHGIHRAVICDFVDQNLTDADLPFSRMDSNSSRRSPEHKVGRRNHASCKLDDHTACGIKALSTWPLMSIHWLLREQWCVLAPVFKSAPDSVPHLSLEDGIVLPYIYDGEMDSNVMKSGGYSEVWPIRIHPAHQRILRSSGPRGPLIAVKRLFSRDPKDFERERDMLSKLTLKNHPHLVKLLITYKLKDKFHLLYPYANANLRQYWRTKIPSWDRETYLWTLQQMCGLASALNLIHNFPMEPALGQEVTNTHITDERPSMAASLIIDPLEEKFGRHGDLKPENILWFDDLENVNSAGILQITDLGLGRFHRVESRSKQDPSLMTGSPTYIPPELVLEGYVSRAYDIWSLGCIFLEHITWIIEGPGGVDKFAEARLAKAFDGVYDDTFYMLFASNSGRYAEVREGVTSWVEKLRRKPHCPMIVPDLLDLVQMRMLNVNPENRVTAEILESTLEKMFQRAQIDPVYLLGDHYNPVFE